MSRKRAPWAAAIAGVKLDPEAGSILNMRAEIAPEIRRDSFLRGHWWILPVAADPPWSIYGLRIGPSAWTGWPLLWNRPESAFTVASNLSVAVPQLLLRYMRNEEQWDRVVKASKKTKGLLADLDRSWGGSGLAKFWKGVQTPAVRTACVGEKQPFLRRLAELVGAEIVFDPAPEHKAYLEYMLAAYYHSLEHGTSPWPPPSTGPFEAATAMLGFVTNNYLERWEAATDAAWRLITAPPSLDKQGISGPSPVNSFTCDGRETVREAAKLLLRKRSKLPKPWLETPQWKLSEALTDVAYDGSAHLSLAEGLLGVSPAAAFQLAITAADWGGYQKRDPMPAFSLARRACEAVGWEQAQLALESVWADVQKAS